MGIPINFREIAQEVALKIAGQELDEMGLLNLGGKVIDVLCARNAQLNEELQQTKNRRAEAIKIIEEKREEIQELKEQLKASGGMVDTAPELGGRR